MLTFSKWVNLNLENAWRRLLLQRNADVNQPLMSRPCPPRPNSRTPAASLMRGWNTPSLQILTFTHPSMYIPLSSCTQSHRASGQLFVTCQSAVQKFFDAIRNTFPWHLFNKSQAWVLGYTHTHKHINFAYVTQIKHYIQ